MTSTRHMDDCAYRAPTDLAAEANSSEQARRRAARWHAWLKSPECTFQDRENFERWCEDAANAAAYIALCADHAAESELVAQPFEPRGFDYAAHAFASAMHPSLEAERR